MITFANGPAMGKILSLRRTPIFLRVTVDEITNQVDALDMLDDQPKPTERMTVYILKSVSGWMHIRKQGGGGFRPMAEYEKLEIQPSDHTMRNDDGWKRWVDNAAKIYKERIDKLRGLQ